MTGLDTELGTDTETDIKQAHELEQNRLQIQVRNSVFFFIGYCIQSERFTFSVDVAVLFPEVEPETELDLVLELKPILRRTPIWC